MMSSVLRVSSEYPEFDRDHTGREGAVDGFVQTRGSGGRGSAPRRRSARDYFTWASGSTFSQISSLVTIFPSVGAGPGAVV